MLYLLDANVLIDANRDYYPIDRVPEFWEWLAYIGSNGQAKLPIEMHEEVKDGKDALADWAKNGEIEEALLFNEEADVALVSRVIDQGYAPDLTDVEIEAIGRDPFLIAYALAAPDKRCVVTTEVSKPRMKRANRRIPDVCSAMGIKCFNSFEFIRALNFKTSWNRQ